MKIAFAVVAGLSLGLTACGSDGSNDPKSVWLKVLNKCASTDLVKTQNLIYFGASNTTGPGSIFRQAAAGDYRIRWPIGAISPAPGTSVVIPGDDVTCSGTSSTASDFNASLTFTGSPAPISAGLQNDLKKAQNIQVSPTNIAWDTVAEGPYEIYASSLPVAAPGPHADLLTGKMLVLYRALRVHGYSAKLDFNSSDALALQAKYTGPQLAGSLGAGLSASWSANGTLTISAPDNFYIAGQLVGYNGSGFSAHGSALAASVVTVPTNTTAKVEAP